MSNSTYIEVKDDVREDIGKCLPSAPKKAEKRRVEDVQPAPQEEKATPDNFKYNIGDIIKISDPDTNLCSPAIPDKQYHDNLRVVFRFWDGGAHVYVVEAEDGIGLFLLEKDAKLEKSAPAPEPQPEQPKGYTEEQIKEKETEWQEAVDKRDKKIDELQREVFDKTRRLKEIDELGEVNIRTAIACLDSVEAMLRHSLHGATHRMRNFYTDAMLEYMDKVRADIKMPKSNDENPF